MKKKMLCVFLAIGLLLTAFPLLASEQTTAPKECTDVSAESIGSDQGEIVPLYFEVEKDTYVGSEFERTRTLHRDNGRTVNFSVTNRAKYPVRIAINNKNPKYVKSGQTAYVSTTIRFWSKKCKFTAAPQGGRVNIAYKIAQRP